MRTPTNLPRCLFFPNVFCLFIVLFKVKAWKAATVLTLTQTSRRFSALHDLHRDKKGDTAEVCQSLCSVAKLNNFVAIFSQWLAPSCNFISFFFFLKRPLTFFLLLLESFGDSNVKPHVVLLTCPPTATSPLPNLLTLPSQSGQMFIPLCPVWKWIVLHNYYIKRNYKNMTVHRFSVTNVAIQMVTLSPSTMAPHLVLWLATRCCRLRRRHKVIEAKHRKAKQLLC